MQKVHLPSGTVRKRMGEIHAEVQAWPQRMKEAIGMSDEKKEGVAAFFGIWPGDETDDEMLAMLKDVRREFRLTDEERDALEWASKTLCVGWHDLAADDKQRTRDAAATLQSLLGRIDATSTREGRL